MKHLKKFYELVDYDYISDYDEIYNKKEYDGYMYLYSSKPLKKNDISNQRIYIYNRADASDTESEYIYQIKTKNPLYKKVEMSFLDEDIVDVKDYSGYFKKDWLSSEYVVNITNLEDVVSFRRIGGFVKYDTHKPDKLNIKLSEKTTSWLYSYIGEGSLLLADLSDDIIEELKPFRPKKPIKIYKGIEEVQIKHFSKIQPPYKKSEIVTSNFTISTSWTTNILVARRFIDEYPSSIPFVITMTVDPNDILVDVQMLPEQYFHANQREIIILPGKYEYKLIWSGDI